MGILLQYASLPSLERASPRIGAYNALLDDENGALTRYLAVGVCSPQCCYLGQTTTESKQRCALLPILSFCVPATLRIGQYFLLSCAAYFAVSFGKIVIIAGSKPKGVMHLPLSALHCRFRMHLNGLSTQHGKSQSVVASQGTSRATSPKPDEEQMQTIKAAAGNMESSAVIAAAASRFLSAQHGSSDVSITSQQDSSAAANS